MNIYRMMIKELKVMRDPRMIIFLLATPLLLILILGTALTNAFNGSLTVGEIHVLYKDYSTNSELKKEWNSFTGQLQQAGISFERADEKTDGQLEVKNDRYAGYVELTDKGLSYYGSSQKQIESDMTRSVLTAFTDRYKLAEAARNDPELTERVVSASTGGYVEETLLNGNRKPAALDYYAIAMTTLIILYCAMTSTQLIDIERKRNTASRLMASPITKTEIFIGKIAGNLLLFSLFTLLVVLFSKYMFQAYWGDNLGMVLLILFTEIVFALSLGIGFSYMIKGNASGTIVMLLVQIFAFLGGSYFAVSDLTGFMKVLVYISPMHWTNDALLQFIYADNLTPAWNAMLLNIGSSVVFIGIAFILMRRREGL